MACYVYCPYGKVSVLVEECKTYMLFAVRLWLKDKVLVCAVLVGLWSVSLSWRQGGVTVHTLWLSVRSGVSNGFS